MTNRGFRFLSPFRVKIWWMIPRVGESANNIRLETQMLLIEATGERSSLEDGPATYVLMLPVLDGPFRTSLQGNSTDELQFCVESGYVRVTTSKVREAVFINSGNNLFEFLNASIKILEKENGTFTHLEHKKLTEHMDWFGWFTWDAFYKDVSPQGIVEGLQCFQEGGRVPKFLVIDDGWQDTVNKFCRDGEPFIPGTQFAMRLVGIKENMSLIHSLQFMPFIQATIGVSLRTLECELLFTVSPITVMSQDVQFAPVGLLDMYNSGGAVVDMNVKCRNSDNEGEGYLVRIKVRGCGRFGAYSSIRPRECLVDMKEIELKQASRGISPYSYSARRMWCQGS